MTKPQSSKKKSKNPTPINHIIIVEEDSCESVNASTNKECEDSEATPKTVKDLFSVFTPDDLDSTPDQDHNNPDSKDITDVNINEDDYQPPPKKAKENTSNTKKYIPKYKKEWENKPELKPWLSESVHGNRHFYCKFCKNDYRCGISDIYKHMSSNKHVQHALAPDSASTNFKFRGLLCPVFTPFHNTRLCPAINFKAILPYSSFLKTCGINGILINDVIGEGMSLSFKERILVTECWIDACKKNEQFLIVQIGGAPLKNVIEMAIHAERKKVGAIAVTPDLYNRPKSHLDLIRYIKLIAEVARDTPILYHHNPKHSQLEISMTSFLCDIIGEVDSFVGLIYTTNDLQQIASTVALSNNKFTIFIGTDEVILGAAASGYTCIMGITLNILPKLVESICESVNKGAIKNAQTSQNLLNKTMDVIYKFGDTVSAMKAAMSIMTNVCGANTREPLQTLWEGVIKKMQEKLHELSVI